MTEKIKKELFKFNIHNEKELDAAIKKMKPINIAGFIYREEAKC